MGIVYSRYYLEDRYESNPIQGDITFGNNVRFLSLATMFSKTKNTQFDITLGGKRKTLKC